MDSSRCDGKCYRQFPGREDPYWIPCANGTKKCILRTSECDGEPDCDAVNEDNMTSDEQNCPWFTQIGLNRTFQICLAVLAVSWVLFYLLIACSRSREQNHCVGVATPSSDPILSMHASGQDSPSFILHPALSDIDNPCWSWQEVGEQLTIEAVFFNRDPQVLIGFLTHIEGQDAHPANVHNAFKGIYEYLDSKGFNITAVSYCMKETVGHHRLAHMALKGPPNMIDAKVYELGKWVNMF